MRRTSLNFTNLEVNPHLGNAQIYTKESGVYGSFSYTWNDRFVNLLNDFFEGKPIHNFSDNSEDTIEKYVKYADGKLSSTDEDYDMLQQFDLYLTTI